MAVELQPVSSSTLRTISQVNVNGNASESNSSASTTTITATHFVNQGINQVQNALDRLPGVTIEHYDNGAPRAVATLSIRGAGGFAGGSNTGYEVLVLQDGEPLRNGQYGDFDLSSVTPSIYQRAELIKGVPLHKFGYGFNYESRDGRANAFIGGTFYATNNAYNLPAFWL